MSKGAEVGTYRLELVVLSGEALVVAGGKDFNVLHALGNDSIACCQRQPCPCLDVTTLVVEERFVFFFAMRLEPMLQGIVLLEAFFMCLSDLDFWVGWKLTTKVEVGQGDFGHVFLLDNMLHSQLGTFIACGGLLVVWVEFGGGLL